MVTILACHFHLEDGGCSSHNQTLVTIYQTTKHHTAGNIIFNLVNGDHGDCQESYSSWSGKDICIQEFVLCTANGNHIPQFEITMKFT
jgi:hypothetical protein